MRIHCGGSISLSMIEITANSKQLLPLKKLTGEINFACESGLWRELNERLKGDAPNEACVFALSRPSRGFLRTTVILRELLWPLKGEVGATPQSLEISSDYITRVMDAAIDAGDMTGVVMIHTHPDTKYGKGRAFFSPRDDWYEQRLFPTLTLNRSQAVSGSIVLGSDHSDVDARIWWNDGSGAHVQPAQVIRVVGPEITFLETRHSGWKDHPDPAGMERSTRLWGAEGRRRLQICVLELSVQEGREASRYTLWPPPVWGRSSAGIRMLSKRKTSTEL